MSENKDKKPFKHPFRPSKESEDIIPVKSRYELLTDNIKEFCRDFKKEKLGLVGLFLLLFIAFIGITGNLSGGSNASLYSGDAPPLAEPDWYAHFPGQRGPYDDKTLISQDFDGVSSISNLKEFKVERKHTQHNDYLQAETYLRNEHLTFSFNDTGKIPDEGGSSALPEATIVLQKAIKWNHERPPNGFKFHFDYNINISGFNSSQIVGLNSTYDFSFVTYIKSAKISVKNMERILESQYDVHIPDSLVNPSYGIIWALSPQMEETSRWLSKPSSISFKRSGAIFKAFSELEMNFVAKFNFLTLNVQERSQGTAAISIDNIKFIGRGYYHGFFGTTQRGGDLYRVTAKGLKNSLLIGMTATIMMIFLGVFFGLFSGYYGGYIDEIIMRLVDFLMSLPQLPIMMVLTALLAQAAIGRVWGIVIVIAFLSWAKLARFIRSQVLSEREKPYIATAKASGVPDLQIMVKHILPNLMGLVTYQLLINLQRIIIITAGLSFLGLGPHKWVSLGQLIKRGIFIGTTDRPPVILDIREGPITMVSVWWLILLPGSVIFLFILGLIFVAVSVQHIYQFRRNMGVQ